MSEILKSKTDLKELETEDGEINDFLSSDFIMKEKESEQEYTSLDAVDADLRCNCCGNVFCDPVTLKCQHLIDRSCAINKIVGTIIECPKCHHNTMCDNVEELQTNFDIASRIPPNLRILLSFVDDQRNQHRKNLKKKGETIELLTPNKLRRNSKLNKMEIGSHVSISRAVTDIISSNNIPKNITMSQFKKFTEISNKIDIISILTKAITESSQTELQKRNSKKVDAYIDSEILDMMPLHKLKDIFELERAQFILLYKNALMKGVILPAAHDEMFKNQLLPIPKQKSKQSNKVKNIIPFEKSKKQSSESSETDFSDNSSTESSSMSETSSTSTHSDLHFKSDSSLTYPQTLDRKIVEKIPIKCKNQINTPPANPVSKVLKLLNESLSVKPVKNNGSTDSESSSYREEVDKLHSIYSTMYYASIKMKEFQNNLQSPEYHSAYKIYTENYSQYQKLYSSIQSVLNMDSVINDRIESTSNGGENFPPDGNAYNNTLFPSVNHEQAFSTIFPSTHIQNYTDSQYYDIVLQQNPQIHPIQSFYNLPPGSFELQQYKESFQMINPKKFGYLWISNLCKDTRTNDICKLFSTFGHISKIKLFQYKDQTSTSFFSLIFMSNLIEAENACRELQNTTLLGRQIHIRMLKSDFIRDDEGNL